ncbi:3-methylornithine--L-lysine ligase PylC [Methanolobus halotolerans]|uniref:3-methylornithine--L-lysine ligase PylC n=1 Tax=Methanolobus halotolerans TaxID=2052935 RepID=A0A4E0Q579_9EURY|nr:3-methylornithine--L-lysine ligase PylC [Methanolobus halotolerans]TGC09001.1 3-methylornithine--L-lysine ligase PylC [Methanolobus halotolerans]
MRTICIIGGKLQGFEVTYLAHKACMKVVLVDRREKPLISNAVDSFHCFDIVAEPDKLREISKNVDAIIPVNENIETIGFLKILKDELSCPVLFDFDAYNISMDKKRSKDFFYSIDVPTPADNPASPPYFIKPPCESSSVGTSIIYDESELEELDPTMLVEEYVQGDIVSLEVIGDGEHFMLAKETKVHVDGTYDCHMVTPARYHQELRDISCKLARSMGLRGIMDIEAIDSPEGLKILEIDARFPSQTPSVVYHSSGINLVEMLLQAFLTGIEEKEILETVPDRYHCTFEQLGLREGELVPVGEHVISQGTDYNVFYTSEGVDIFECTGSTRVFTLMSWGPGEEEAENHRQRGLSIVREYLGIKNMEE